MAGIKYYGQFGGQYVSESLMNTLAELEKAFDEAINDPQFIKDYMYYLKEYVGRETPLYYAERISEKYGAEIYLKREDLNHTGAHKINNVIGQILLAKRMGKTKVIAETGAGQHGVATATGAAADTPNFSSIAFTNSAASNNVNFSIDSKIASILIVISPFLLHFLVYFVLPPYFV